MLQAIIVPHIFLVSTLGLTSNVQRYDHALSQLMYCALLERIVRTSKAHAKGSNKIKVPEIISRSMKYRRTLVQAC
jgi:hypothetical protein